MRGKPPWRDLKQFAEAALPTIEHHLDMAQDLDK
jgi:predicted outer membrane protein